MQHAACSSSVANVAFNMQLLKGIELQFAQFRAETTPEASYFQWHYHFVVDRARNRQAAVIS